MADTFDLLDLLSALEEQGRPYYEFLQRDSLSAGIYHLPAGEPDRQQPHTEDEVYYVLAGEGRIDIDGDITAVRPGSVIFVGKHVPHRFIDYTEGITLLVIFAPARGSNAPTE
jgi:mannose-6-phosphate isomerase-like protein (cupin superfamily)